MTPQQQAAGNETHSDSRFQCNPNPIFDKILDQHLSSIALRRSESSPSGDLGERRLKSMKAKELDKKFDDGEDITKFLDLAGAKRPGREQRRVNVDFPAWMIERLDKEARRLGVTRQSIIKVWIADRLQKDVP
jgi:hypothetical protein